MNPIKLSLHRKSVPVELDGSNYTLIEISGKQRDQYLTLSASRMRTNEKGEVLGIREYDGLQTGLLAMTLHGPDGKAVLEDVMSEWPAATVEALFEESQKLNGMGKAKDKEISEAKNGSGVSA